MSVWRLLRRTSFPLRLLPIVHSQPVGVLFGLPGGRELLSGDFVVFPLDPVAFAVLVDDGTNFVLLFSVGIAVRMQGPWCTCELNQRMRDGEDMPAPLLTRA